MNYRKSAEALLATGLAGALTTGCTLTEGDYTLPKPTRPNHTIEQVAHNMDYATQLGKLTLHQQFSIKLAPKEHVEVYNFTETPVNKRKFKAVVRVMQKQEYKPLITEVPIHPRDGHRTVTIKTEQLTYSVKERDFVLVPASQPLPKIFTHDNLSGVDETELAAATYKFDKGTPEISQRVSVVQRPTDYYDAPARFLGEYDNGLPTEICQSMVDVSATTGAGTTVYDQMAQETVCNDLGGAVAGAEYGDYKLYKELERYNGGTVDFAGNDYWIEPVTLSQAAFTRLEHELGQ